MNSMGQYFFVILTVYSILIELEAVTVSTFLCPTNKISPRQRQPSSSSSSPQDNGTGQDNWEIRSPRTLDLIYNLLGPSRPQRQDPLSDLQEQPQEDDRDDCGGRQGVGKKDLSSATQNGPTKSSDRQGRKYTVYNSPPYSPGPNIPPYSTQRPLKPAGPPNNLEGNIKPVWEYILEPPLADYRPDLIGGPLTYIVGFSSRMPPTGDPPTEGPLTEEPLTLKEPSAPIQFPKNNSNNTTRQTKSQQGNSTSLIKWFVDLLFN